MAATPLAGTVKGAVATTLPPTQKSTAPAAGAASGDVDDGVEQGALVARSLRARSAPEVGSLRCGERRVHPLRGDAGAIAASASSTAITRNDDVFLISLAPIPSDSLGLRNLAVMIHPAARRVPAARFRGLGTAPPAISFPVMMPTEATYFGVPGTLLFALVLIGSIAAFAYTASRRWQLLTIGGPPDVRWDRPLERLRGLLELGIFQKKMWWDGYAGLYHMLIFSGFVVLSVRTLSLVLEGLFPKAGHAVPPRGRLAGLPPPEGRRPRDDVRRRPPRPRAALPLPQGAARPVVRRRA